MVSEAGAEMEVVAPDGGAEVTMSQYPVKEEGPGKPLEVSGSTLRR